MDTVLLLETSLLIQNKEQDLIACLNHKNISNDIAYVLSSLLPVEIFQKINGRKLRQKILLNKRDELTLEDYDVLLPQQSVTYYFMLNEIYEFDKAIYDYVIYLYKGYYNPITDKTIGGSIKKIEFKYIQG